jgi:Cu/Ag efflux protein CusF
MKISQCAGAVALALSLAACGDNQAPSPGQRGTSAGTAAPAAARESYSAAGAVTKVAGNEITISHGPVDGIGWPAMTMAFHAGSPDMIEGIAVGDEVAFAFREDQGAYVLTSLSKGR